MGTSIEIPRPPSREAWTLLELSFGYITRESRQSSSFPILNQPRLTHSARFSGISKSLSNPQDSFESARYFESARLPNATDSHHGFSSIEPLPSTAHHSFRVSAVQLHQSSRDPSDFFGFVGCDLWAPEPLFSSSSFRCPVPFCGSFSLWPQALLIYAHGFCYCLMPAGPFPFMPTGLLAFISKGPCPPC